MLVQKLGDADKRPGTTCLLVLADCIHTATLEPRQQRRIHNWMSVQDVDRLRCGGTVHRAPTSLNRSARHRSKFAGVVFSDRHALSPKSVALRAFLYVTLYATQRRANCSDVPALTNICAIVWFSLALDVVSSNLTHRTGICYDNKSIDYARASI